MADIMRLDFAGFVVTPGYVSKMAISFKFHYLSMRAQVDGRVRFEAPDQISRHTLVQAVRSQQQVNPLCRFGQERGSLPGRVSSAYYHYVLAHAQLRFHWCCTVVNTSAFKLCQVLKLRFS